MDLAQFREYCLSKACTAEGTPFGPDVLVFKVGGKMFALAALDELPTTVNLKCDPDLALELLTQAVARIGIEGVLWIRQDTDWASLHGDTRFEAIMDQAESRLKGLAPA